MRYVMNQIYSIVSSMVCHAKLRIDVLFLTNCSRILKQIAFYVLIRLINLANICFFAGK